MTVYPKVVIGVPDRAGGEAESEHAAVDAKNPTAKATRMECLFDPGGVMLSRPVLSSGAFLVLTRDWVKKTCTRSKPYLLNSRNHHVGVRAWGTV